MFLNVIFGNFSMRPGSAYLLRRIFKARRRLLVFTRCSNSAVQLEKLIEERIKII